MPVQKQINVRLEVSTLEALSGIAAIVGTSPSEIVRTLTDDFVDRALQSDGSVIIPARMVNGFKPADARTVKVTRSVEVVPAMPRTDADVLIGKLQAKEKHWQKENQLNEPSPFEAEQSNTKKGKKRSQG